MEQRDARRRRLPAASVLWPWLVLSGGTSPGAEVPPYFERLIEGGGVEFEFYDPRTRPRLHAGFTTFDLQVDPQWSFRYRWVPQGGRQRLTIWPTVRRFEHHLTHHMLLPERLNHDGRWNDRLVKHEFDHVAIDVDPRVQMLLERLFRRLTRIERTLGVDVTIDEALAKRLVGEEYARRTEAVIQLLKANNHLLDDVSQHGLRPIPERKEFFGSLFTRSNLEQMKFPYLDDVEDLLKSDAYRNAETPYATGD